MQQNNTKTNKLRTRFANLPTCLEQLTNYYCTSSAACTVVLLLLLLFVATCVLHIATTTPDDDGGGGGSGSKSCNCNAMVSPLTCTLANCVTADEALSAAENCTIPAQLLLSTSNDLIEPKREKMSCRMSRLSGASNENDTRVSRDDGARGARIGEYGSGIDGVAVVVLLGVGGGGGGM
jgi:hypothetical protein